MYMCRLFLDYSVCMCDYIEVHTPIPGILWEKGDQMSLSNSSPKFLLILTSLVLACSEYLLNSIQADCQILWRLTCFITLL